MNHSLRILSCSVKFALHLVRFMTNFELQLQEATKISVIFDFSFLEWRVWKNRVRDFWLRFTSWDIGLYYIFVSFEIGTKNRKSFITWKPHILSKIVGTVLLSGYFLKWTPLLKELRQRFFWVGAQTLFTYRESSQKDLYIFITTITLIHLQDQSTCDICGMHHVWAKIKNLQFVLCLDILALFKMYMW